MPWWAWFLLGVAVGGLGIYIALMLWFARMFHAFW